MSAETMCYEAAPPREPAARPGTGDAPHHQKPGLPAGRLNLVQDEAFGENRPEKSEPMLTPGEKQDALPDLAEPPHRHTVMDHLILVVGGAVALMVLTFTLLSGLEHGTFQDGPAGRL